MSTERARELRRRMTPQEVRLWIHLRLLRPQGLHFRRQMPLGRHVVDFACKRRRLVVEVDGAQHGMAPVLQQDAERDRALAALGYRVLRVWNADVDRDLASVVDTIFAAAQGRL